jgi:hypothetical protein
MQPFVYYKYKDKIYAGYELVYPKKILIKDTKHTAIVSDNILSILHNLPKLADSLLATDVYPLPGSSIYAASPCMFDAKDLRNNFKLKRSPDTGDYNVFSSLPTRQRKSAVTTLRATSSVIIPSRKMIIANNDKNESCYSLLSKFAPEIDQHKHDEEFFIDWGSREYMWVNLNQDYLNLLEGKFEKPCIPAENLKLYHDNPLSLDTLEMVYRAGVQDKSDDAVNNYLMQLSAMNLRNWRDYPGTISILFGQLLNYRWFSASYPVHEHPEKYEKFVAEMRSYKGKPFLNQEDQKMATDLIERLIGLDFTQKHTWQEVMNAASRISLQLTTLFSLYDNEITLSRK